MNNTLPLGRQQSRGARLMGVAVSAGVLALTVAAALCADDPAKAQLQNPTIQPGVKAEKSATKTNAPPKEPTVVTSEKLQIDYAHNVGTFTGNVLAVDPQITLRADKMVVFFGVDPVTTNRTMQKMVADGSVIINQETKTSHSEHAVYTAEDGKCVLTGKPVVTSADGTVTGKVITFWRGEDKMDVESDLTETNRTRLVIFPDDQKKKSPDQPPKPDKPDQAEKPK